ncbi:ChrR family anti-sigma-E factor [Defluviimonas sp. WL0002]|uniref:ChrR family anti-sigma-E factor n=1 Tax=Albidovulum marisflavi TaxID=2984159 RepID=A0ABT2ZGN1_9RHOB|nr:ChrR family anti-sigma-E factor [Defluviimonas sp. WL0002]MCV2870266.1 ChrR family anti-sigma-E factor [Defluviimonas sp. WL0002]
MTDISHHVPDWMIRDYVGGALSYAFDLVVATHVSMCDECRARLGAHEALAGAALDASGPAEVSDGLRDAVLARLDDRPRQRPRPAAFGVFPAPLAEALHGRPPRWRSLGLGVRQCILHEDRTGSARLLFIPPEQAVPEHGHRGLELTLVLQGSFHDETDQFEVGDLEVADSDLTHVPVAGKGAPCICLAATNAPLRFKGFLPRLTQRLFRI